MFKNQTSPITHQNKLLPSTQDMMELGIEVENKFLSVSELHFRVKMMPMMLPMEIQNEITLWRGMLKRWDGGDMRHTRAEQLATRVVAQWTLDMNRELRNQPPMKIQWKD